MTTSLDFEKPILEIQEKIEELKKMSLESGMDLNRDIGYDIIAGPFLILGDDYENGDFKSLNDDQILRYKMRFDKNSIIETENKITAIRMSNFRSNDYER